MATNQNQNSANNDPEVVIEEAINKTEKFFFDNGKQLLIGLAAVILIVGCFFGYKYLYQAPQAGKAADAMFVAEQMFAVDSFAVALNGDGNNDGFLDVIKNYGSTPQANLAKHYAGVCYLKTGDIDNALEYLKKFSHTTGAPNALISAQNYGLQGDILSQQQNYKESLDKYQKAVEVSDNLFTTPLYLKKAALVAAKLGDNKKAVEMYQRIVDEFPSSMEARDAEKYIGQLEQK